MTAKWIETLTGSLEDKKQYKAATARVEALPAPYRDVARALQRYFMYYGMVSDGEMLARMVGDHADLWERAALDGMSVRDIVGDDPVEFAETFVTAYSGKQWIDRERTRLRDAFAAAEAVDDRGKRS